jgi:hypothetical protein
MESKILKARGAIVHAKEIAHKKRQQEFLLKSQYHARLETKLQVANELKEKQVGEMLKKLEDHNGYVYLGFACTRLRISNSTKIHPKEPLLSGPDSPRRISTPTWPTRFSTS